MSDTKLSIDNLRKLQKDIEREIRASEARKRKDALSAVEAASQLLPHETHKERPDQNAKRQIRQRLIFVLLHELSDEESLLFDSFDDYAKSVVPEALEQLKIHRGKGLDDADAVLTDEKPEYRYVKQTLNSVRQRGEQSGRYPNIDKLSGVFRMALFDKEDDGALWYSVELSYYKVLEKYLKDTPEARGNLPRTEQSETPSRVKVSAGFSIDPAILALIQQAAKNSHDGNRTQWLTDAALEKLTREGYDTSPEGLSEVYRREAENAENRTKPQRVQRVQRVQDALPDPTQPAKASVNRPDKAKMIRMSSAMKYAVDAAVKSEGSNRKAWITAAANELLTSGAKLTIISEEKVSLDAMVPLRLDPADRERIEAAAKKFKLSDSEFIRQVASWKLDQVEPSPDHDPLS